MVSQALPLAAGLVQPLIRMNGLFTEAQTVLRPNCKSLLHSKLDLRLNNRFTLVGDEGLLNKNNSRESFLRLGFELMTLHKYFYSR